MESVSVYHSITEPSFNEEISTDSIALLGTTLLLSDTIDWMVFLAFVDPKNVEVADVEVLP